MIGDHKWTLNWSMAGVWLVQTGPNLKDQLSFKEEDAAKARLVAAAPDLLEALKEMLEAAEADAGCLPSARFHYARDAAFEAITKATGEA